LGTPALILIIDQYVNAPAVPVPAYRYPDFIRTVSTNILKMEDTPMKEKLNMVQLTNNQQKEVKAGARIIFCDNPDYYYSCLCASDFLCASYSYYPGIICRS